MDTVMDTPSITIDPETLKLIAGIDEFKGAWKAFQNLAPDRLNILRKVATIESVGSSTRIEGVKLTDGEIERLLSGVGLKKFRSRDEQEVAGYAEAMNVVPLRSLCLTGTHHRGEQGQVLSVSQEGTGFPLHQQPPDGCLDQVLPEIIKEANPGAGTQASGRERHDVAAQAVTSYSCGRQGTWASHG